jgi:caffeoyl-CoA O-methyltransferase
MSKLGLIVIIASILSIAGFSSGRPEGQNPADAGSLDVKVRQFMESRRYSWRDLNVPEVDGQALHDIVLKNGYKNALEIGTSTGYSGLWIALALSKTGGKLITIEIDKERHDEAVANFREAGVAKYVDARLGDAHTLVPALSGPFDFVFCDADKDWYKNYLSAALPKINVGGCFAAHNVSEGFPGGRGRGGFGRGYGGGPGIDFLEFARSFPNLDTKVLELRGSGGLAVSYKKAEK